MSYDPESERPSVGFTLKGIPAVILIIVLAVGYLGYRHFLQGDIDQNPQVRSQIEMALMSEIAGDITRDLEAIDQAMAQSDRAKAGQLTEGVLQRKVVIDDLQMRGGGEKIIVKAQYTVEGPEGPEKKTGYFRFGHSAIGGWRYKRETTAFSWHLALF